MDIQDPQYRTPDGSALRIWRDTAKNNFLTEREGRPIFDEVILVEVISPGSRDSTPVFEAERTFAKESGRDEPLRGAKYDEYKTFIEDFKKSEEHDASLAGTPLKEWSEMTRTLVASLKMHNIFTVEALAALPDSRLSAVGPDGRTWREKARAYVETAKNAAYATELASTIETLRTELGASQDREKLLAQRIQELEAAKAFKEQPPASDPLAGQTAPPSKGGKAGSDII